MFERSDAPHRDDDIEVSVAQSLGCSVEDARKFLTSERGAFRNINGVQVWISGQLIYALLSDFAEYLDESK